MGLVLGNFWQEVWPWGGLAPKTTPIFTPLIKFSYFLLQKSSTKQCILHKEVEKIFNLLHKIFNFIEFKISLKHLDLEPNECDSIINQRILCISKKKSLWEGRECGQRNNSIHPCTAASVSKHERSGQRWIGLRGKAIPLPVSLPKVLRGIFILSPFLMDDDRKEPHL